MAVLDTLVVKVVGDASQFSRTMAQGRDELGRFTRKTETLSSKLTRYAKAAGLAATKTGLLGAAAATGFGIKLAAQAETAQVAFETLTGNVAEAGKLIKELNTLASRTPLSQMEIREAGRNLLAFGEGTSTIPQTLRRIGDVAALTNNRIGELAEIYGKARVQGTLFAEDINQLTGRGIPVIEQFAKQLGVSTSEVKKLGSEGKITFKNLEQAFVDMTSEGGKFAGGLSKQADTLAGKWSTLTDELKTIATVMGQELLPAIKSVTTAATNLLKALREGMGFAFGVEGAGGTLKIGARETNFGISAGPFAQGTTLAEQRQMAINARPISGVGRERNDLFFQQRDLIKQIRESMPSVQAAGVAGAGRAADIAGRVFGGLGMAGGRLGFSLREGANRQARTGSITGLFSGLSADPFGGGGLLGGIGRGINRGVGAGVGALAGLMPESAPGGRNDRFGRNTAVQAGTSEAAALQNRRRLEADMARKRLAEAKKATKLLNGILRGVRKLSSTTLTAVPGF